MKALNCSGRRRCPGFFALATPRIALLVALATLSGGCASMARDFSQGLARGWNQGYAALHSGATSVACAGDGYSADCYVGGQSDYAIQNQLSDIQAAQQQAAIDAQQRAWQAHWDHDMERMRENSSRMLQGGPPQFNW